VTDADAELTVALGPMAAPVLNRVAAAMAARADLPVNRVADVGLMADAIAAHAADGLVDGVVRVALAVREGELRLRVGPFRPGGATRLLSRSALPDVGPVLEPLADEVTVDPREDGSEYLVLAVSGS
jgi:hypothetical protein